MNGGLVLSSRDGPLYLTLTAINYLGHGRGTPTI